MGQLWLHSRGREEGGVRGGFTLLNQMYLSRPSLFGSWRSVVPPLNQCELAVFLPWLSWSPTTPRYIMLMWYAADRLPGSYRDWSIHKIPRGLYNSEALFLYTVLSRSHWGYVYTLYALGHKLFFHVVGKSTLNNKNIYPQDTQCFKELVDGQLLFLLSWICGQKWTRSS